LPYFFYSGENSEKKHKWFFFERQWFLEEDFMANFSKVWQQAKEGKGRSGYSLDIWHGCLSRMRQFLRVRNANKVTEQKKSKLELVAKFDALDKKTETRMVDAIHLSERYLIEDQLEHIYQREELY
jgi:hypothetical protein